MEKLDFKIIANAANDRVRIMGLEGILPIFVKKNRIDIFHMSGESLPKINRRVLVDDLKSKFNG